MTADQQPNEASEAAVSQSQASIQDAVSNAIEPVIRDLQSRITQTVREQMSQGDAQSDGAQSDGGQSGGDAGDENGTSSGDTLQEAADALRETFQLLGTTLRKLLETLQSLLKSVGLLLQGIFTALTQGLPSVSDAIKDYVSDQILSTVSEKVQGWVQALIDWIKSLSQGDEESAEAA